jgi:hypothetical protein
VILTSASRSGGEARIMEAERLRRIHQGQSGCKALPTAYTVGMIERGTIVAIYACCTTYAGNNEPS